MSKKFSITGNILNKSSTDLAALSNNYKITYIEPNNLIANEHNFYSVKDVEKLKDSIIQQGLQQALVVNDNNDDTYTIISGHRRLKAVMELISEGNKSFDTLPCRIVNISSEDEIKLALINANATSRELTDFEKMQQVTLTKQILNNLRQQGFVLSVHQKDFIANELNMSASAVQRLEFIDKNLNEGFKEKMEADSIPLTVAIEIAKLNEEEQVKLYKETFEKGVDVSQSDVKAFKVKQENKAIKKETANEIEGLEHDSYIINASDFTHFDDDRKQVADMFAKGVLTVSKKEYANIINSFKIIKKNYSVVKNIMEKVIVER